MKTIVPLPVQILYSCTLKFRHKLLITVALRKKSSRQTWNKQEPKEAYHIIQVQTQFECCHIKCLIVGPMRYPKRLFPQETYPLGAETWHRISMSPQKRLQKEDFIRDEIVNKEWVDSFSNTYHAFLRQALCLRLRT